jgi:hypothetical protein
MAIPSQPLILPFDQEGIMILVSLPVTAAVVVELVWCGSLPPLTSLHVI